MGSPASHDPQHKPEAVGLGHLPVELLLEIASDLVLEDLTTCTQVSRQWHAAWTRPALAAALCHRFFPTQPKPHTYNTFRKACRRFFRRRHGKYTAVVDLTLRDRESSYFGPDIRPPFIMAYGGGNIVWTDGRSPNGYIFVDNLYTQKRKVIRADDWDCSAWTPDPTMCAVSKSLLATIMPNDGSYSMDKEKM